MMPSQKRIISYLSVFVVTVAYATLAFSQSLTRREIRIPDIPGYLTLKCDFHIHTVFSDGEVWPTTRAMEAWMTGLDAFAITDHLEYLAHKDDIKADRNRSYDLVKTQATALGLITIKAAEITKSMPPGHMNILFIKDAEPINQEDWRAAVKAAIDQGAFLIWNHPGWRGQQPDGVARWYAEHSELLNNKWMQGIEVFNSVEYYPEAHKWALEKKLTMFGNSDAHEPIHLSYDDAAGEHRPVTLVFAKERTEQGIKEALLSGRTAVYCNDELIGEAEYLKPLFDNSISVRDRSLRIVGRGGASIQIANNSDFDFHLVAEGTAEDVIAPPAIDLRANRTTLFIIRAVSGKRSERKTVGLHYRIRNLKIAPDQGLPVVFEFDITFVAQEKQ